MTIDVFRKRQAQVEVMNKGQMVAYLDVIQFYGFEILFEELTHTGTLWEKISSWMQVLRETISSTLLYLNTKTHFIKQSGDWFNTYMLSKIICSAYFWANELSSFVIFLQSQPIIPISNFWSRKFPRLHSVNKPYFRFININFQYLKKKDMPLAILEKVHPMWIL